jgi:hypothetical protein
MPGDYAAVPGGLAEELVVPEAHSAFEQLRRWHGESGIPKQVMKALTDSPRAQSVKDDLCRVFRFVGVVFVKERIRVHQPAQLFAQDFHLFVGQQRYACDITVLSIKGDLLVAQPVTRPIARISRNSEKLGNQTMASG